MRKRKAIDEWAFDYWLLQTYSKLGFHIYYRRVEITNKENLLKNQPVILAPNHQNALMDAMIFVCNTTFQPVFLARADIFKGKFLIRLLTSLNIMPVYRIRDGIGNVRKNDGVFDKTLDVLYNKNNPLSVFPEGNHGDKRRLRQLVKGLFRIAFQAQEKYGNQQGVKIIPVGFDYGHYTHFRTTIFVNVGKPIEVSEYYNEYAENPVAGINKLKERFISELRPLMIDIQTDEYYDLYMNLREVFNDEMRQILHLNDNSLKSRFRADKKMIEILDKELESVPDSIKDLDRKMKDYQKGLQQYNLRDWVLKKEGTSMSVLVITALLKLVLLPVFVAGIAINYLPYWFTASRTKNIKDQQFHSSFKYVIGLVVFPVWYLVLIGILAILSIPLWAILAGLILSPITGIAAFNYYIRCKKFLARWRFLLNKKRQAMVGLVNLRKDIINTVHQLIVKYNINNEFQR